MQFTVVKSIPGRPAKFIKVTPLQDQAILSVLDETRNIVKKAVKSGHRVDITDSCNRSCYLGNVFIGDKSVRDDSGRIKFAFAEQFCPIRQKMQERLYKASATAVFISINDGPFSNSISITRVATDDEGQPTKVPNWWKK